MIKERLRCLEIIKNIEKKAKRIKVKKKINLKLSKGESLF